MSNQNAEYWYRQAKAEGATLSAHYLYMEKAYNALKNELAVNEDVKRKTLEWVAQTAQKGIDSHPGADSYYVGWRDALRIFADPVILLHFEATESEAAKAKGE